MPVTAENIIAASLVIFVLLFKSNAFVLKSETAATISLPETTTIAPSRLAAASRNVLHIRAGLPRGVLSQMSPSFENPDASVTTTKFTVLREKTTLPTVTTTTKSFLTSTTSNSSTSGSVYLKLNTNATSLLLVTTQTPSSDNVMSESTPVITAVATSFSSVPKTVQTNEFVSSTTALDLTKKLSTILPSVKPSNNFTSAERITQPQIETTFSIERVTSSTRSTLSSSSPIMTGNLSRSSPEPVTSTLSPSTVGIPDSITSIRQTSVTRSTTLSPLFSSTAASVAVEEETSPTLIVFPKAEIITEDLSPVTLATLPTVSTTAQQSTVSITTPEPSSHTVTFGRTVVITETVSSEKTTTKTAILTGSMSTMTTSKLNATVIYSVSPKTLPEILTTESTTSTKLTVNQSITHDMKKTNLSSALDVITVPSSESTHHFSSSNTTVSASTSMSSTASSSTSPVTTATTSVITAVTITTPTTIPEPCDRTVSNLMCTPPDFDKSDIFAKCSWDVIQPNRRVDSVISYKLSIREMTEGLQNQVKSQVTNLTSYPFPIRPGKQYEIIVNWIYLSADDADMSDCKLSTFILAVPYERPKLQADPDWLSVNMTLSAIYIKNPFYQLQNSLVGRLSVDLTLSQKNSSIVCVPAYWYNVQLSEKLSCEIKNLNNDTIDDLLVTLNASGDPMGKDPSSFVFTRQAVAFKYPSRTTNPDKVNATLPTPSSSPVVDNAAAAGGGVAAGVVVGAALVVLLIFLVRRHRKNTPKQTWQANVSMPPGLALGDDAFASTQNFSHSTFTSGQIPSDQFEAYVASLERNSGLGYASLWEDVRLVGLQQTTVAADLPANRLKNRFTNVLPYDSSRVKLLPWPTSASPAKEKSPDESSTPGASENDDSEMNDYVNASFVPGLWSDHEYIATQGPLPHTIQDFWRTVWQQRVCAVVMLTKLKEGGARKCECYWPPNVDSEAGEFPFGPLNIQLVSQSDEILSPTFSPNQDNFNLDNPQENYGVWTIRDFRISMPPEDGSQQAQTRTLKQYQFNAWPDQGVPSGRNRSHLLRFVRLVRSQVDRGSGKVVEPILVHCSAGVGRSGAFIAVDILLQDLAAGQPIDVTGVVRKLREYRQLVQTEQQFRFIHELLLDAINGNLIEGNGIDAGYSQNKTTTPKKTGNGFETVVVPSRRNKGKANTAFENDDDVQSSELDDRV